MGQVRYKPIRRLGSGGIADVFLSREYDSDGVVRRVALKRIVPDLGRHEGFRQAFEREIAVTRDLAHPNIVAVHDAGAVGDGLFLTMDFVEGRSLHDLLVQAARLGVEIPIEVAMAIGLDLARGLHHAHTFASADERGLGLVHGDLSPRNVLVGVDGTARITDFGLAAALGGLPPEHRPGPTHLGYASPEQARGEPLDHRSDLYNLGILLWELTAGRKLFQVRDPLEALEVIGVAPIPAAGESRALPPGWEGILRRALAPAREHRYASARALEHDIEDVARAGAHTVSNLDVVSTIAMLFPELALEVAADSAERRPHALLVDADSATVELLLRTLRPTFQVRVAGSVDEAIAALQTAGADVVIAAAQLPGRRGLELMAHLARERPRTVRIMVAGAADPELMASAINLGRVHRFVVKPLRPDALLALVEEAVADHPRLPPPDLAVAEMARPAPPMVALPWESLQHLAAPMRDDALSCMMIVGVADNLLGEMDRAAIEWVLGSMAETCWLHVEGRGVVLLVPGASSATAARAVTTVREAVLDSAGARFAAVIEELAAGADIVDVGRRNEEAALAAWRTQYGHEP